MSKEVTVNLQGFWSTTLEVPDDFDPDSENLLQLVNKNKLDFCIQDGSASWEVCGFEYEDEDIDPVGVMVIV